MSKAMQPLSIVVPALNEADNLAPLVSRIAAPLRKEKITYEVLIIDDHSTDTTADVVASLAKKFNVRLVMKTGKRGKASSLLQGFDEAQYPLICMIDADLQYPPEAIVPMYRKLAAHDADVVVTNRVDQETSPLRQLSTKVFHFLLARMLFGIDYDTQSGLKLFKKTVLDGMDLKPSAWSFDLEFLVRSLEKHCVIISHAIPFSERTNGEAKVRMLSTTYELVNSSLKLRMNSSIRKVRRGYRASLELSRRPAGLVGLLIAGATVGAISLSAAQSPSASALSLQDIRNAFTGNSDKKEAAPNQQPAAPQKTETTPSKPKATTPPPTPTTPAAAAAPSQATETPAATPGEQPVASKTPADSKVSGDTNHNKSTDYYPPYALSNNKTSRLKQLAATLGLAGGAAVILGGITWAGRTLYLRHIRKTSRNLYRI